MSTLCPVCRESTVWAEPRWRCVKCQEVYLDLVTEIGSSPTTIPLMTGAPLRYSPAVNQYNFSLASLKEAIMALSTIKDMPCSPTLLDSKVSENALNAQLAILSHVEVLIRRLSHIASKTSRELTTFRNISLEKNRPPPKESVTTSSQSKKSLMMGEPLKTSPIIPSDLISDTEEPSKDTSTSSPPTALKRHPPITSGDLPRLVSPVKRGRTVPPLQVPPIESTPSLSQLAQVSGSMDMTHPTTK